MSQASDVKEIVKAYTANPALAREAGAQFEALLSRSATDVAFRQQLVTDPRAAVAAFTGRDVPATYNIHFIENTGTATFVLPDPIDPKSVLSDSELETVSGGVTPTVIAGIAIGAAIFNAFATGYASD